VPSQIHSSAKYRETAKLLHIKFKAGRITHMEYQACLKAAVANALIAARENDESLGKQDDDDVQFGLGSLTPKIM
jgi:hypothetical protein